MLEMEDDVWLDKLMRQAYPNHVSTLGENITKSIKEGKSNEKSDKTVGALASVQPTKSLRRSVFTSHELHADAPNIDFWGVIVFRRSPIARQRKPTASPWKPNLDMDWLTRARTKLDFDERTSKLGFGWECLLLYTKHRTHKFPKGKKNPDRRLEPLPRGICWTKREWPTINGRSPAQSRQVLRAICIQTTPILSAR